MGTNALFSEYTRNIAKSRQNKNKRKKKVVNDLVEIVMMIVVAAPTLVAELSGALGIYGWV